MDKRFNLNLFFLAFTLVLSTKFCFAQSYYFRNYSVEDGLPFIEASVIFQDQKGNLWSGGYGGLSKFDGIQFTNYSPNEGLLNHLVTAINEDKTHNLWIGTISGINVFDGSKFKSYTTKEGLPSNSVSSILRSADGDMWIGTNKGIGRFQNGEFIRYSVKNGLGSDDVKTIFQDRNGSIWVGTAVGISRFNGSGFVSTTVNLHGKFATKNKEANIVNGISEDNKSLWLATEAGLIKFETSQSGTIEFVPMEKCWDKSINSILYDSRGNLWLGTEKGLIKYDHQTFSKLAIRITPNSNYVHCLFQDYESNLWVGTSAGLFKYRGNPFVSFGINDGLTSNFIHGLMRDSKGNLWIGSQGGGLFKYLNHQFFNYEDILDTKGTNVNSILEFAPNTLWLATNKGLMIYDNGNCLKKFKNDTSGVFANPLNTFYRDSKSNIWIAGQNEIYKYNGKTFITYRFKSRSENFQAWSFVEDQLGNIWIGTYLGGLIKFDGKTFTECSEQLGFGNDSFLASLIDKEGNLYFGCLNGVWMYNPSTPQKKPINFNQKDGMSSDLVYSLTFVKGQNEIWAGTNQGLNKIDIAEFKKTGEKNSIPFGKQEGFTGVECNNGSWVDKDGAVWFATVYGLIKYDPNEYIENRIESKISITGFSLFYNDTILKDSIHLGYSDNNITFNYSGICLTNPNKVKYKYILEGFEKTWSPPSKERLTTYSNLPPGAYTFKVISSNNENLWNVSPANFTFTINRPFWKTFQFYLSLVLSISLVLFFSLRFRIRQIKTREKQKTEMNKKIANIESQALRAQMNPHFIFNTMSSIQDYISSNNTDAALRYLSKFAKLMRKIMDNSKQQLIPVAEEMNALQLYLELEVMRFDKKFEYHINVDNTIDSNYDRIPSMLIQPYVENAIIHGLLPKDGSGKISITLQRQNDTIECTIEDNGIGRQKSFEFKKNRIQQHKSMGMSITKERLAILNSSLKSNIYAEIIDLYEKGKASGTKVILIIPIETND